MTERPRLRGRPIRLPFDASPLTGFHVDSGRRISWLLLTLRLHAADEVLHHRRAFAGGLVSLGVNADPSRVSRWESGAHHVPERVLYGYGELLGLPRGHLTSVAHALRHSLDPGRPPGLLLIRDVPEHQHEFDELFARIEADEHHGTDWTKLAASLGQGTVIYLPEATWETVAEKLLTETVRSTGIAHIRRAAACAVVAQHASSQRVLMRSIGRLVTIPGPRYLAPPLMLLRDVADAQADRLLLQMLEGPRGPLRNGTASVIAAKLARGQFSRADRDRLVEVLTSTLAAAPGGAVPTDQADVLNALDPPVQRRVIDALSSAEQVAALERIVTTGLTVPEERVHRLAAAVARRTIALSHRLQTMVEPDRMLIRLIEEALVHVHRERRHQAIALLAVSPFSRDLPAALLASVDPNDHYLTGRCLSLITFLRPQVELTGKLLTWAFHHPNVALRSRAILALIPLGTSLVASTLEEIATMGAASPVRDLQLAVANLLGTCGAEAARHLTTVADEEVRSVTAWWAQHGALITEHVDEDRSGYSEPPISIDTES